MPVTALSVDLLSAELRKEFNATKGKLLEVSKQAGIVRERMAEIAPRVIGLYDSMRAYARTHKMRPPTVADFARMYDPTVPTHAGDQGDVRGYRNHKVYYTITNMQRAEQRAARATEAAEGGEGGGRKTDPNAGTIDARSANGVREVAVDVLARILKTILQIVPTPDPIWAAVQDEFKFTNNLMTRLKERVSKTDPLLDLSAQRVKVGKVIHMERPAAEAEGEEAAPREPLAQPGRNISIAAAPAPRRAAARGRRKRAA